MYIVPINMFEGFFFSLNLIRSGVVLCFLTKSGKYPVIFTGTVRDLYRQELSNN